MSDFENNNPIPEEPAPSPEASVPVGRPAEPVEPVSEPLPETDATPAEETSAEETPAEETSNEETPAEETPAEETSTEETCGTQPIAETAAGETSSAETEDKAPEAAPAPAAAPHTAYRWSYADEAAHHTRKKGKGVVVYAAIMTAVFLLSFGLLLAVLLIEGDDNGYTGILRPGITDTENDDEAVAGVEQAKHSVVVIEVRTESGGGTGTGIIMTSDGYIATNHHVIEDATRIKVTFYDGTVLDAETVGSSEMDDLAVIKVEAAGLPAATFAHSDDCYVGQTVYAIGTPAGADFGWTTTKGIVSYKDREVKIYNDDKTLQKKLRLLQTDANVNPGNSGGPLINTKGEVVGVVSMKLADGYEGIGFAIPSDGAVEILEAIMEYGNADNINSSLHHKRPMLGIRGFFVESGEYYLPGDTGVRRISPAEIGNYQTDELIHPDVSGIYIAAFVDGMDASDSLRLGDIITACQGVTVTSMNHLSSIINEYYAGDTVTLTVYRGSSYTPMDIVLLAQPGETN